MTSLFLHSWLPWLSWFTAGFVERGFFCQTGEPDGGAERVLISDDTR